MLGGKVLWKRIHEPYPTSLYFKSSGLLYLNFDPYYYVYAYDGNSWVLRKDLSHRSAVKLDPSMYPKDITIVTEKTVGESLKLVENDTDLYRVYDHGNGIFLYVFDTNSRCVEVKYRGHTVTKRQSRGPYPRRIVFYSESLTFEFDFESRSTVYRVYDAGWYISDDSNKLEHIEYQPPDWILKHSYYKFGSKLSLSKLTIMTSDNKDGSGAKPIYIKSSMFHCNKWISGYFYPVNGLYLELGYKGLVFFKSTDYPYRGNPRVVLFDLDNHNICVFFDTGFKVSFNHIDDSDKETVLQAERMPRTVTKPETDSDSETETTPVQKTVITPAKATPASGTKSFTRSVVRTPKEPVKTKSPESKLVSAPVAKELSKTPETKPPVITILPKPIRPKSFTNVTVDIEKKQSTNAFNYYKNDNFRTYVPKPGYLFSKVTERAVVIWKSRDVFATFVTTKRKNFLVILLQSGSIVLFHKTNADQPWEDITNKRYDVTKFKFLGENDAEISTSDYKVTLVKTVVEFTLNDGVDCNKIKYENQVIWEYTDSLFKQFELGLVSNEFHPLYSSAYRRKVDYKVPKLSPETEPTKTTEPKPASAPVSSVTTTETKATPTTSPPLTAPPEAKPIIPTTPEVSGEVVTPAKAATVTTPAKAPSPKVPTPPTADESATPSTTPDESATPVVTTPAKAPDAKVTTPPTPDESATPVVTTPAKAPSPKVPTPPTADESATPSTTPDESATPVVTTPAKAPDAKVTTPPTPDESATPVVTTPAKAPDAKVTTPPTPDESATPSTTADESATPAKATPSATPSTTADESATPVVTTPKAAPKTEVVKSTDPVPAKVSVSVEAPTGRPRPKRAPEAATGPRTAVPVNITVKESSSTVDFSEDYLKNVKIYSAKLKYAFNQIVISCCSGCCKCEKVIWETTDPKQYFDKVFVDGLGTCATTRNFSIHLCNGSFKHFGKKSCGGGWSEYPSIIDLDLKTKDSNIQLDLIEKDNCRTYVAKPGYTIRRIRKNKKCGSGCCGERVIWESIKDNALKVVLVGIKKEEKHLSILLETGEPVFLYKEGKGKPWQNVTASKNKLTDLRMYALAEGNKQMELHRGHYSVTLFGTFYGCLFYDDVCCVKVSHKDKTIWDKKEEKEFGNLKGVFLDVTLNKFSVMNDDDRYWLCEEVKKINPVRLDINEKASTEDYDYTVDHNRNINIYTAKGNSMFNQVAKGQAVAWTTNDPTKYASKVFTSMGLTIVTIYLLNGDILHYRKPEGGSWNPIPNKICLELNRTSSRIFYDFHHDGEKRTFTAKPGFLFNSVILKSSWTWLVCGSSCCKSGCLSDKVFLDSQKDDQCSTKVVVYGTESSIKNINIFLKNGSVVHFHKVGKKWFSETPIVVDIDINKDNDLFDYRPTRTFGHFNPKANLTIEKIVKKNRDIWKAQKDHGLKVVLMGSGKEEKHLSILLQSGNFVLLQKSGKGESWKDITKNKHNFQGVKLYSLDEGTSKYRELTREDYDPTVFESRYGYEFKDGVKCSKITDNDKIVWTHTDDMEFGYPKGLYLDLRQNTFSITNLKDRTKELHKGEVRKVSRFTKVTLDIEKTHLGDKIDYSQIETVYTFVPNTGHAFSKISLGNTSIWQCKDVCGILVKTKTKENKKYVAILLEDYSFSLFEQYDGKTWNDVTDKRYDVTALRFYGDNDKLLNDSDFKATIVNYSYEFKFNDGVTCKKIKYGDDVVWRHTDDPDYSTIKMFHLGLISNKFLVLKSQTEVKKLEYKGPIKAKTVPVQTPVIKTTTKPEPAAKPEIISPQVSKVTRVISVSDTERPSFVDPKYNLLQTSGDLAPDKVKLYSSKSGGNFCKVEKYFDDLDYNLEGLQCEFITHDGNCVWRREDGKEYPDSMTLKDDDTIIVTFHKVYYICYMENNEWKSEIRSRDGKGAIISGPSYKLGKAPETPVTKDPDKVKEPEPTKAEEPTKEAPEPAKTTPIATAEPVPKPKTATKPVTLDIENKQSTTEFDYKKDGSDFHLYTPKPGHSFTKVTEKENVIWESKDGIPGTLVRKNKDEFVAILLGNCDFVLFNKDKNTKTWKDITSQRHNVSELKFLTDNDKEIASSDFTRSIVHEYSYEFKFNTGVKCLSIKYGNNVIWKHTDDNKYKDITKFQLGLVSNNFFVFKNENTFKKVEYKGAIIPRKAQPTATTQPKEAPATTPATTTQPSSAQPKAPETSSTTTPTQVQPAVTPAATPKVAPSDTLVTLDISKTQSTADFEYSKKSNYHTYTPKSGSVIGNVTHGTTDIWESKDGVFGTLVRKKKDELFVILLKNNDFVLFQKTKKQPWADITKERHNVTELKFYGDNDTELKSTAYLVTVFEFSYRVTFKDQNSCKKIKYGDNEIWKYTNDPCKHFELGLVSNNFFVCKNESSQKNLNFKGGIIPRDAQPTAAPTTTPTISTVTTAPESQTATAKGQQEPKAQDTDQEEAKSATPATAAPTATATPTAKVSEGEGPDSKETAAETPLDVSSYTRLKTSGETPPDTVKLYSKKKGELVCAVTKDDDDYEYSLENLECEAITHDDKCVWKRKDGQGHPLKMIYNGDDIITINFDGSYVLCTMFNNEWHLEERKSASTGSAPAPATTPAKAQEATTPPQPKAVPATAATTSSSPAKVTTTPPETKAPTATTPAPQVSGTEVTPSKAAPATTQPKAVPVTTPATPSATTQPSSTEAKAPTATTPQVSGGAVTPSTATPAKAAPAATAQPQPKAVPTTAPTVSTAPPKATVTKPIESKQPEVKLPLTPLNPVTLDMDKTQATPDFDYAKDIKIKTYTPASGFGFNEIVLDKTVIWKSRDKICATLVVLRTSVAGKHLAILLNNNLFELLQQSDKDKPWEDITSTRADVTKLKFYDDGDAEITPSNYKVTILHYSYRYTYEFNDGVNCMKVKYAGRDIWNCSDDQKFGGPIKIFDLGLITNNFFVKNLSQYKKSECDSTNQIPLTESIVPLNSASGKKTVSCVPKVAVTVQVPVGRPRPKRVAGVGVKCTGTAVPVNIGVKSSTDTVDYNGDSLKNVKIYTPKVNYVFNQVVMGTSGSNCCGSGSEKDIWTARDESEYFYRVYVDGLGACTNTSNFSIHLCNGTFRHFNNPGHGNWREVFSVIDFDMSTSSSNIEVDFIKKDNYRTYVPKPGYKIRTIVKGDIRIWECQNNDYAIKAVLMGSEDKPKRLLVLLQSGNAALLYKSKKGEKWRDITSTKNSIANLKMYTIVDNEHKELNPKQYSVTLFDSLHGYVFYEGVNCVKIVLKDKTLWEHNDKNTSGNLKGIFLNLISDEFSVMNDDDSFKPC
ncbi:hypothetical protein TpMuguga_04g00929 [Theileria parva strain Muguga]|uniref:Hypothetical telomeric SfiI 20 protein 3 n=1 Tax=Theileria parva TaxID=5875 RepID=Q4N127_THEPA|nr:uncharacterized protein TpMuguga_04g00929 [Theileria parva strain Muguga]EAN32279.1 hypothetical protein TpMuguga_04g00929 [Theileria parva strain Muguga]|eukprot:XP_764562.1 hypothetical protein [Theileria parva strain Muguga]